MNTLRKIFLGLSCAAFAVCGLFLNGLGGTAILMHASDKYRSTGIYLLVSVGLFAVSLAAAFFRGTAANIISALTNAAATGFFIYAAAFLTGIPDSAVPAENIEVLTARIYPSLIITVCLFVAVIADILSPERIQRRIERKKARAESEKLDDKDRII